MKPIPTAKEYIANQGFKGFAEHSLVKEWMIEFAKLHVEAALKEASEEALCDFDEGGCTEFVDKESILNAYPLDNIK